MPCYTLFDWLCPGAPMLRPSSTLARRCTFISIFRTSKSTIPLPLEPSPLMTRWLSSPGSMVLALIMSWTACKHQISCLSFFVFWLMRKIFCTESKGLRSMESNCVSTAMASGTLNTVECTFRQLLQYTRIWGNSHHNILQYTILCYVILCYYMQCYFILYSFRILWYDTILYIAFIILSTSTQHYAKYHTLYIIYHTSYIIL